MPTTKIHWGQIVTVFSIILFFLWTATQWIAWQINVVMLQVQIITESVRLIGFKQ